MPIEFETPAGATPLEADELEQLIPSQIADMAQLNEAEQLNIAAAELWVYARKRRNVLTMSFARNLHKRMYGEVWKWAGILRTRAVNIGNTEPYDIPFRLQATFDDVTYWIENNVFPFSEIAVRLHHQLTLIHAFPNGNGRHARLMANVLLENAGQPRLTWGSNIDLVQDSDARSLYIFALHAADDHDLQPLIEFASS